MRQFSQTLWHRNRAVVCFSIWISLGSLTGVDHYVHVGGQLTTSVAMSHCATFDRRYEATKKQLYQHKIFEVGLVCQSPKAVGSQNVGHSTLSVLESVWGCIAEHITFGPSVSVRFTPLPPLQPWPSFFPPISV